MATPNNEVVQHLRRAVLQQDGAGLADGELLGCLIERRDEAAAAALVRRHAPMVWGVCRRVLGHEHDAEDAFQATFLVLARRARAIAPREMVGNWLYGVAHRTALKARALRAKRRARERPVADVPEPAAAEKDGRPDLRPLLDQEVSRLPDKYRAAVVLCDLEGKTRKEAARQLAVPEGTLSARLARARAMLARRLARHGLAVPGGAPGAVPPAEAAPAGVPAVLMCSAIKAVARAATGLAPAAAPAPAGAAALAEEVLKSMALNKLRTLVAAGLVVALALGIGGAGLGLFNHPTQAAARGGEGQDARNTAPAKEADKPRTDQDRLQGTWEFVAVAQGDKTIRKEDLGKNDGRWDTITFTGDEWRAVNLNSGGKAVEFHGRFKLDPSRKPKAIDLTPADGEARGEIMPGLYEVDGDSLRLCLRDRPSRPAALDSREVAKTYLLTFKRAVKGR
jgi:RNA polymerase sigma factor (sigma-70 family)